MDIRGGLCNSRRGRRQDGMTPKRTDTRRTDTKRTDTDGSCGVHPRFRTDPGSLDGRHDGPVRLTTPAVIDLPGRGVALPTESVQYPAVPAASAPPDLMPRNGIHESEGMPLPWLDSVISRHHRSRTHRCRHIRSLLRPDTPASTIQCPERLTSSVVDLPGRWLTERRSGRPSRPMVVAPGATGVVSRPASRGPAAARTGRPRSAPGARTSPPPAAPRVCRPGAPRPPRPGSPGRVRRRRPGWAR